MDEQYDKPAIIAILMRRDGMSHDAATDLVNQTQEEIDELVDVEDLGPMEIHGDMEDIIQDNLGLEPDYLMTFLD